LANPELRLLPFSWNVQPFVCIPPSYLVFI